MNYVLIITIIVIASSVVQLIFGVHLEIKLFSLFFCAGQTMMMKIKYCAPARHTAFMMYCKWEKKLSLSSDWKMAHWFIFFSDRNKTKTVDASSSGAAHFEFIIILRRLFVCFAFCGIVETKSMKVFFLSFVLFYERQRATTNVSPRWRRLNT